MIDFIDSFTELSEENISSVEFNYTAEYDSFSNTYFNLFEKDASYVISRFDENDQKSTDDAYTVIENNENSLILKNTLETEYGTVYRYIMISLQFSLMEEWMEVSNEYGCHISGRYEMDKVTPDEKELTFMLKTGDGSQKVMKIRKL